MNQQLIRFLCVGVINTAVGLSCIYFFLNIWQISYWWSTWLGNSLGLVCSYFLNRKFTFGNTEKIGKTAWKFLLVFIISYSLSYWMGLYASDYLVTAIPFLQNSMKNNLAVLIGACLYTVMNYAGHRSFTFKNKVLRPYETEGSL